MKSNASVERRSKLASNKTNTAGRVPGNNGSEAGDDIWAINKTRWSTDSRKSGNKEPDKQKLTEKVKRLGRPTNDMHEDIKLHIEGKAKHVNVKYTNTVKHVHKTYDNK